jgi:uncharacterized membrane protein YdcZ (DUF606 family)
MIAAYLVALIIGSLGVLQNTLNKQIGSSIGIPLALVINNLVLLSASILFLVTIRWLPEGALPELFQQKESLAPRLALLVPGLMGFFIIATAPWAIGKVGALKVFLVIIVAQIVVSIAWDQWMEGIGLSAMKIAGVLLALLGTIIVVRS